MVKGTKIFRLFGNNIPIPIDWNTVVAEKLARFQPPPPLPLMLRNRIIEINLGQHPHHEAPKLLIQKYLFPSDVVAQQGRLLIPNKQMIIKYHQFLTPQEIDILDNKVEGEKPEKTIKVLYEKDHKGVRSLVERDMVFCRWPKPKPQFMEENRKTSLRYALRGSWMEVVEDMGLKEGNVVQVGSFRYNNRLGFALVNMG